MIFQKEFPFIELQIRTASNGKEELLIAKEEAQDIIITDIKMPIMDGKEAVRKIRLFDKSVPILALTALTNAKDVREIIESGVSNYTSKPLNKKLFIAQIKAFVNFYLKNQFKYNKNAINLMTKEIFKRKTIFSIEKLEDLFEFWEYILGFDIVNKDNTNEVLQYIYSIEETIIKMGKFNEIILEEGNEGYYFTLTNIDEDLITGFLLQHNIKDQVQTKYNSHMITFVVEKISHKEEQKVKEKDIAPSKSKLQIEDLKKEIEEAKNIDFEYSTYEKVSATQLAEELDPSIEDKIEDFIEELELSSEYIYRLEEPTNNNPKDSLLRIVDTFRQFDEIIENIGLFNAINRTFDHLISFLENLDETVLFDLQKRILLSTLLRGLMDDFDRWVVSLFIDKDAPDIHYLDASFAENTLQLEYILLEKKDDENEQIEFF